MIAREGFSAEISHRLKTRIPLQAIFSDEFTLDNNGYTMHTTVGI